MYNALQLNSGNGTYREIAQLSGVSSTDWSWSALFADFDNDGYKDLIVTNGLPKDMRNKDYLNRRADFMKQKQRESKNKKVRFDPLELLSFAPSEKISNFVYKNQGDLTFSDKTIEWGMDEKGFSHGAAYADFDLDGDLDIVLNNMNDEVSLFRNNSSTNFTENNYIRIKLLSDSDNKFSTGTTVEIQSNDKMQLQELSPVRGYMSTSEHILHFGVGNLDTLDEIIVTWPNGKVLKKQNVKTNQLLVLNQADATRKRIPKKPIVPLFEDITVTSSIKFQHSENQYDDYKDEVLLPYRLSRLGPYIATGDVNGNGLDDFFIGAAAGQQGELYLQQKNGVFKRVTDAPWSDDRDKEDLGSLFFDADNDGDVDLYVISGGNEFKAGSSQYQDRLYLNNGKGIFTKSTNLPSINVSGSVVTAADYDNDNDLDLFIGGRQIPGKYGWSAQSYVLQNNNGVFTDVTKTVAPELDNLGMVTDAKWFDIENDGDIDLVIVGEWMPITVFKNTDNMLHKSTPSNLKNTQGWWSSLAVADMDKDGDMDLIAGNLGLNIKYKASIDKPFKLFSKDFDNDGTNDVYLSYSDPSGNDVPVRGRECSTQEMPFIKNKFKKYNTFAIASVQDILSEKISGAVLQEARIFESSYFENNGNGDFILHTLPNEAQLAPIYGILPNDWNKDGHIDLVIAGNFHEREVETTRSDAGTGQVLLGDGKGNFKTMPITETGLKAIADARALETIKDSQGRTIILIGNNNQGMQVYRR